MTGKQVFTMLLTGSFDRVAQYIPGAEPVWAKAVAPGTNPIGFTLWHMARTLDWSVQTTVRGVDEVARRPQWRDRMPADCLFGAGVPPERALSMAQEVGPDLVAAYNEAVRNETLGWLASQDESAFDEVVDFRARQESAGYTAPEVWEEIASLEGIPVWQFLARPAMAHIRVHAGEIEVLLQLAGQTSE